MYSCQGCDTPAHMGHHEECVIVQQQPRYDTCRAPFCHCDPFSPCPEENKPRINISSGEDAFLEART